MTANTSHLFPYAPDNWNAQSATNIAQQEGLDLSDDHWEAISGLQEYFARNEFQKPRQISDALDEKFHSKGGMKQLYRLFPKGPVAQGCRIAGIAPPAGSVDLSFGSVR